MSTAPTREREEDNLVDGPDKKRQKFDTESTEESTEPYNHVLPPSHALLGIPLPKAIPGAALNFLEADVGISEYIGRGEAKVEGIIKQRFTDFLVYEVDLDGNVLHVKDLGKPKGPKEPEPPAAKAAEVEGDVLMAEPTDTGAESTLIVTEANEEARKIEADAAPEAPPPVKEEPWPERFNTALSPFLSEEAITQLKTMYLEGPEPPRVSDSGWAGRVTKGGDSEAQALEPEPEIGDRRGGPGKRGGRGRRGGRDGGRGGQGRVDTRKVVSKPIDSKDTRTAFHKVVRELFNGKLETETDTTTPATDEGSRIVIKWVRKGGGARGGRGANPGPGRAARGTYPPYIHFTMQKTNRDTQDALGHLSRLLHVNVKDLSVAGTKDKRGVTVQRVSLNRHSKTVEDIWRLGNNIEGRRTLEEAMSQRGERGIRIADFNYRKASLELGMLKGNAFLITLRNVKVESMAILDEAMNTIKTKGFINYYGMQRFGTASVPTHAIGLALLRSDWQRAIDLILQKRHGEHPDVEAARDAWLVEGDLDKALSLFPRRVVAERCILESFKKQKGDTRNVMGALSTIPRNLRLMYIHAYQSYVWNAIVSERIKTYGSDKPIVGDLVFENAKAAKNVEVDVAELEEDTEESPAATNEKSSRKPYVAPKVKTLTEEDLDKYSIFDVIMPLPGTDVAYPGGQLGERYQEFLRMDGLDPNNFVRRQKEYTLNGSYRVILHLPKELSWSILRYTDPDVSLAQSDEDKLLGFDPPAVTPDGKFMALQIQLQLGTAAYATMALREITKTDTSAHVQSNLTLVAEDQKYRGSGTEAVGEDEEVTQS